MSFGATCFQYDNSVSKLKYSEVTVYVGVLLVGFGDFGTLPPYIMTDPVSKTLYDLINAK
jgi:hypothetical protein